MWMWMSNGHACGLRHPPRIRPNNCESPLRNRSNRSPPTDSDLQHLLQGMGDKGLTKLFHQLSILAWAVVLAKLLSLAAPWEENSPVFTYLNEILGHKAGDLVLEAEELLVRLLP
jgi:hypothetical protein